MDFKLTEQQREMVDTLRKFRQRELAPKAIRWLNDAGYYVFAVTNQARSARELAASAQASLEARRLTVLRDVDNARVRTTSHMRFHFTDADTCVLSWSIRAWRRATRSSPASCRGG